MPSIRSELRRLRLAAALAGALFVLLGAGPARADRLLDLCDVVGMRDNQLIGYGVVVGLNGTGDDVSAPFAMQSLRSLLRRLGVQIDAGQLRLRNVAAVLVTADIPAFVRSGARLDVTVSSVGNARSLRGGVLAQTPLRGADRRVYAAAQGPLVVGGFEAGSASGSGVQAGPTNTARIPSGGLVEREIKTTIEQEGVITLALKQPGFATASRVVEAINNALGSELARAIDAGAVKVQLGGGQGTDKNSARGEQPRGGGAQNAPRKDGQPAKDGQEAIDLLAKLSSIEVSPDTAARVVINERTGTVVAGGDVRLLPVAIAQGGITIQVREQAEVYQPGVLSKGETKVVPHSEVDAQEARPQMVYLKGAASLAEVAQALSSFGVSPRELASILQALKSAGALRAEIVVQ
ncbi:MAG TPA: flagellar basal body P-ring protein FlgI [Polyangiaceae bacterium]|nr:flagellar basal body P-ring protein FlgI [Polyangiaceae bacterium]